MSALRRVVILLALCWTAAWPHQTAAQMRLEGTYTLRGSNPGSSAVYIGEAVVARRGAVYEVIWQIGAIRHVGTGILVDDRFSVVYQPPGERPGLVIFKLRSDGTLAGIWTALGSEAVGLEVWTPKTVQ